MIAARANEQAQSTTVLRGWRAAIFPLLILLIGGLAYSDSLRGVMVLDDQPSIVNNSVIRTLLPTRASIAGPPWTTLTGRPVTTFSFALNYRLGGLNVRGFHLTNIAIHLLAALTLWGIVRRTLRLASLKNRFAGAEDWLAAIIAMLWVAHPLTTSAVTYISQRAESLMSLFYCLTIYFFIRGASTATAKNVWFGLSLAACMVGMGTKEVMASAPLLVLLYDRLLLSESFAEALKRRRGFYLGLAITLLPMGILIAFQPRHTTVGFNLQDLTGWDYLKTQARAIVLYMKLCFWPSPLIFYYGKANYDVPILRSFSQYAPFGLIVVCLLGLTLWGLIRGNPLALPAIVFFFVLAPSSSILAMIDEVVAEHRMYLPLAMVIIFTVIVIYIFLTNFARRETSARRGLLAAGGIIALIAIVALMIATYQRNKLYRSRLTLWTDNVNKQPNNSAALNDLGNAEIQDHLYDQARQHLERAIDLRPNIEAARLNLGQLFDMLGESDRALDQYRLACEYNNNSAYANLYLAEALAKRGNFDEPIQRLKRNVIPFIPWEESPRVLLGALLMKTDHPAEANQQFDAVLQIDSNKVFAQKLITDKLIEFGLIKAAEEHFREIIDLTPNDSVMLNNLAWIEAAYPDASGRDGAQAVQLAQRAIALSGKNPSYLSTLAAAYAENGQYDLAAATQQQAIQLAEKAGQSSVIESWNQRLLLYRSGQPFHEKPMVR